MKEYSLQINLVKYLESKNLKNLRFFHVPNQGARTPRQKIFLYNLGLRSGCPDLVLEFKNGKIVYIELKTQKGTLFSSQKAWLEKSNQLKTPHYILKGEIESLKKQLDDILLKHYKI